MQPRGCGVAGDVRRSARGAFGVSGHVDLPVIFAIRRLEDGRLEVVAPDCDPRRPSWRRYAVLGRAMRRRPVAKPGHASFRPPPHVFFGQLLIPADPTASAALLGASLARSAVKFDGGTS